MHGDARDRPGEALDLRAASFGQLGTDVRLTLRTQGPWSAGALAPDDLCLRILRAGRATRLCVGGSEGEVRLVLGGEPLDATVVRPSRRSLRARIPARSLRALHGRVRPSAARATGSRTAAVPSRRAWATTWHRVASAPRRARGAHAPTRRWRVR